MLPKCEETILPSQSPKGAPTDELQFRSIFLYATLISDFQLFRWRFGLRSEHPARPRIHITHSSCEGGTSPIMLTVGGETTVSTTTTANADVGVDL